MTTISVADLFAGAGGCTTGCLDAAQRRGIRADVVAVNHWPVAVATHTVNHPEARHFCATIETLDPRVAVPSGCLDLLIAAPECVFHSTARGGKPIDDQRRASAWHILRWLEMLHVEDVIIENVPEFQHWGPLGKNNRPLKSRRGDIFRAFIAAIEALNYRVEWKVLNAADYGAATTRRRLFVRATRGRRQIAWPDATHSRTGSPTLFGGRKRWRPAREIIDWSISGQSIFQRKRPLRPATMRRILEGLRRFGGSEMRPFIIALEHGGRVHSAEVPLPTITTAKGGAFGVAEPFLVPFYGENGEQRPRTHSLESPLPVQPTNPKFGLCEPFVLQQQSSGVPRPVDQPVPTLAADGAVSLVEPFLTEYYGNGGAQPVSDPIPTVTTRDRFALVQPVVNGMALDIKFRMLQPHELSAAMGFPKSYVFTGNKGDAIRQIGNAVSCEMARALVGSILDARRPGAARPVEAAS
jgi:DNA (cytosine-5)-methyltransferase 1